MPQWQWKSDIRLVIRRLYLGAKIADGTAEEMQRKSSYRKFVEISLISEPLNEKKWSINEQFVH